MPHASLFLLIALVVLFRLGVINYVVVYKHFAFALLVLALRQDSFVRGVVVYSLRLLNATNHHHLVGDQRKFQVYLRLEKEIVKILMGRTLLLFLVTQ